MGNLTLSCEQALAGLTPKFFGTIRIPVGFPSESREHFGSTRDHAKEDRRTHPTREDVDVSKANLKFALENCPVDGGVPTEDGCSFSRETGESPAQHPREVVEPHS